MADKQYHGDFQIRAVRSHDNLLSLLIFDIEDDNEYEGTVYLYIDSEGNAMRQKGLGAAIEYEPVNLGLELRRLAKYKDE